MKRIESVKGDILPQELGVCQCHEHLFIADGPSRLVNEALYMNDYEKSCTEASTFKLAGGDSFIDAQPYRCGRMAEQTAKLCEDVGLNAICCTGFHKIEFHEDRIWLESASEQTLTDVFLKEIRISMSASDGQEMDAKAGLVKCALTQDGIDGNKAYAKLFHAACSAAATTGAPVYVHLDSDTDVISLLKFFEDGGVPANQLILCHLDRARYDFSYHLEVAQEGAFLEYDTIKREKYHSNEDEIRLIGHMVDNGFADKLLLGMDTTNLRLKSYGAPFGMDYILTDFRYQMEEAGITAQTFTKFMTENAANALAFKKFN